MVLMRLNSSAPQTVQSQCSPWMTPLAYRLGYWLLPTYFRRIQVIGQAHLPRAGAVILAPTHRSRWDALLVPYAAGRVATGRDIHFMVTVDEVKGIQGWLIRRLGGFPVNPRQPAIASLRHGLEVLQAREMLVIFPEGGIFRGAQIHPLKPGLARLALQAEASQPDLNVQIVPIHMSYSQEIPTSGCEATVKIGQPLQVADYINQIKQQPAKQAAQQLTHDLTQALSGLAESPLAFAALQHGQMHG